MTQAGCKQNFRLDMGELVFDLALSAYLSSRVACRSLVSDVLNSTNGHRSEVEFVAATKAWVEKDLQISSNPEFQRNWDESMCKAFLQPIGKK